MAEEKKLEELLLAVKDYFGTVESMRKHFPIAQKIGLNITPNHFYFPIPDISTLSEKTWQHASKMLGLNMEEEEQLRLLKDVFSCYTHIYKTFPLKKTENNLEFTFENDQISGADPFVLYALIRHLRPEKIIEVGSGFSTLVTAKAVKENKKGQITCIEPFPRDFLKTAVKGIGSVVQQRVQEIDPIYFESLNRGDILFIDSSHVVKIGSDVNYLFLEILPRLKSGVWIHIHDIFFPHDYPEDWIKRMNFFWGEQYLLQAFLCFNHEFKIRFCVSYMGKKHLARMQKIFPGYQIGLGGGSCWIQKI